MRRAGLICLPLIMVMAGWSMACAPAGLTEIPVKGKNAAAPAPVPKTGQKASYGTRDDGALQKGVAWPAPRFTDNNNDTVTDNLTGLIWMKNSDAFGRKTWDEALSAANNLKSGDAGLTDGSRAGDWRLPNVRELQSLFDYGEKGLPRGHPFTHEFYTYYWSSSTCACSPGSAWTVAFQNGGVEGRAKSSNPSHVWCVRAGPSAAPAPVPKTGQTKSYGTGDDGALQKGVAWPAPRFTDNNNGTVTDNLTGLIWTKNANAYGEKTWDQALSAANNLKSGDAGLTDGSQAGDWRLPNVRELQSLIDYGRDVVHKSVLPPGHPFEYVQIYPPYWSSSTGPGRNYPAWVVRFDYGTVLVVLKSSTNFVWCVRAGP